MSDEKARLKDVLNYQPDKYLSEAELDALKGAFKQNPLLIKVLRKVLMPTIADAELPIEMFGNELWFAGGDLSQYTKDEMAFRMLARHEAVKFICGGLIALKNMANTPEEETEMEKALRRSKDSSK